VRVIFGNARKSERQRTTTITAGGRRAKRRSQRTSPSEDIPDVVGEDVSELGHSRMYPIAEGPEGGRSE